MTHRTGIEPVSLNVKFKIAKVAVRHFQSSRTGTRTRVSWVKAKYPNRLDYTG